MYEVEWGVRVEGYGCEDGGRSVEGEGEGEI